MLRGAQASRRARLESSNGALLSSGKRGQQFSLLNRCMYPTRLSVFSHNFAA